MVWHMYGLNFCYTWWCFLKCLFVKYLTTLNFNVISHVCPKWRFESIHLFVSISWWLGCYHQGLDSHPSKVQDSTQDNNFNKGVMQVDMSRFLDLEACNCFVVCSLPGSLEAWKPQSIIQYTVNIVSISNKILPIIWFTRLSTFNFNF